MDPYRAIFGLKWPHWGLKMAFFGPPVISYNKEHYLGQIVVSWSILEVHGISIIPANSYHTQVYHDILSAENTK